MIKVYKAQGKSTKLFFSLEQYFDSVSLVLVDENGNKHYSGNILRIAEDGLHLFTSITEDAPFRRNSDGQIKIID
jgi:hypothetical protein